MSEAVTPKTKSRKTEVTPRGFQFQRDYDEDNSIQKPPTSLGVSKMVDKMTSPTPPSLDTSHKKVNENSSSRSVTKRRHRRKKKKSHSKFADMIDRSLPEHQQYNETFRVALKALGKKFCSEDSVIDENTKQKLKEEMDKMKNEMDRHCKNLFKKKIIPHPTNSLNRSKIKVMERQLESLKRENEYYDQIEKSLEKTEYSYPSFDVDELKKWSDNFLKSPYSMESENNQNNNEDDLRDHVEEVVILQNEAMDYCNNLKKMIGVSFTEGSIANEKIKSYLSGSIISQENERKMAQNVFRDFVGSDNSRKNE